MRRTNLLIEIIKSGKKIKEIGAEVGISPARMSQIIHCMERPVHERIWPPTNEERKKLAARFRRRESWLFKAEDIEKQGGDSHARSTDADSGADPGSSSGRAAVKS